MADAARELPCAPLRDLASKDELVTVVTAPAGSAAPRSSLDALSPRCRAAYLQAANEAVQPTTAAFARDFAGVPGAKRLLDAHEAYVIAVTRSLLERARAQGEIRPVDTAAVAYVLGGLGRELSRREVEEGGSGSAKANADAVAEIVLRGLAPD
jgi:hypothetical protein